MIILYVQCIGENLICSLKFLISSIPRLDAPSISTTSIDLPLEISWEISDFGSNSDDGPLSAFIAMARILAVVVLPTPLGPVKI